MNIQILHMVPGARAATGLTVIIDVFRAFTVETYLMRANADKISPVGDVQVAFACRAEGELIVLQIVAPDEETVTA